HGKPTKPEGPLNVIPINTQSCKLKWNPPCDGDSTINRYIIEQRAGTKREWTTVSDQIPPDVTSYDLTSLKLSTEYYFRVCAENAVGRSEYLESMGITITFDLSSGMKIMYRGRAMVLGASGAGKTSTLKSIFGEPFEEELDSTDGIKMYRFDDDWCKVEDDSTEAIESAHADAVANTIEVKQQPQSDSIEAIESERTDDITNAREVEQQPQNDSTKAIESAYTDAIESTIPQQQAVPQDSPKFENIEVEVKGDAARIEQIKKNKEVYINKLMERLKDVKDPEKEDFCFTLFDFGGQEIYYISHQVFMQGKFLYIIVTDISKKLDDPVTDQERQMNIHLELETARDFILYWANTILTYAMHSEDNKYPKIVIIATKADKISKEEAIRRLHEINTFLSDVISQKMAVKIAALYAISNKVPEVVYSIVDGKDKSGNISLLKDKLMAISKSEWFKYRVNCKWLELELQLKTKYTVADSDKRPIETIKEVHELARKINMSEDDADEALEFYYRIGEMVCLEEKVCIKPEWFADLFKLVITYVLKKNLPTRQTCFLKPLEERGELNEELLDKVLESKNRPKEDKPILIEIFKRFDIICEVNQSQPVQPGKRKFIMPCMLTSSTSILQDKPNTTTSPALHYHFPDNCLPSAVFYQLVVRCASAEQCEPKLYKHAAQYYWSRNALTVITIKKEGSDIVLTVTFKRLDDDDEIPNQSHCGPEIRKSVDDNLNDIIKKYRPGLSYEHSLKCPCGKHDLSNRKEDDGCVVIGSLKGDECWCNAIRNCKKDALLKSHDLSFWFDPIATDPNHSHNTPAICAIKTVSSTQLTIQWKQHTSEVKLQHRMVGETKWCEVPHKGGNTAEDEDLKPDTRYYYRLRADGETSYAVSGVTLK
ncbi:uncharacterized protein LOC102809060, partial [Saccoglossus kowalevskii]|uniref:Uncharacterized protein LOC102809060 n=1 Tax=Saccoglossus kowalevskii TaxID=10224 RepID=A0ABM0MPK9_SACKO